MLKRILNRGMRPIYFIEKMQYFYGIKDSTELSLPNFLCIGVQKSGSSWLHESLSRHPEIFMPPKKELDFFSNNSRFLGFSLKDYASNFSVGSEKIKGEATPYCDLPASRIQYIKKIMPYAKLIMVLRNPIDRIWALGLMHLVRAQKKNFSDLSPSDFKGFLTQKRIFDGGVYFDTLKKWHQVFPPSQLLICFYDDLVGKPQEFFSNILQHIGVRDTKYPHLVKRVNQSPEHEMPEELRIYFLEKYRPSILKLSEELGDKVLNWSK